MKKNNEVKVISKSDQIKILLKKFMNDNDKIYKKIIESLLTIGNFSKTVEFELYETVKDENKEFIRLFCTDLEGKIFIICPLSTKKDDLSKFTLLTNTREDIFDVKLSKKYNISNNNYLLMRTDKVIDFKFGRLITDRNSYFNLFLSNDVCISIVIDNLDGMISLESVVNNLNKLENAPTLKTFSEIIDDATRKENLRYGNISLESYKNFECLNKVMLPYQETMVRTIK